MFDSVAPCFLLATPTLLDPNFLRTAVLLFHHSEEGAMGLVINRPSDQPLGQVLETMDIDVGGKGHVLLEQSILIGGPVRTNAGWMIFEGDDPTGQSIPIEDGLNVTGSMEVFKRLLSGSDKTRAEFLVGYAGWGAGQLEAEMEEGAWMPAPLDRRTLFETPYQDRWRRSFLSIGVDPSMWSFVQGEG
ncbi:MAG: YqgE/AlgH family protein [Deltaproteobacteria bacterium]|nr:YqgE/AlgH family protein [Deltaproteobacteria bacterium]